MRFINVGLMLAMVLTVSACGTRSFVVADSAKYPISMSPRVRGPAGELLGPKELKPVGVFDMSYKTCRMLWTLVPLWNTNKDISSAINKKIKAANAEAVVNLRVESAVTIWSIMTLVGVLPDCGSVKIHGELVVRANPTAPPATTRAPVKTRAPAESAKALGVRTP